MGILATAIGYIKTDAGVYLITDNIEAYNEEYDANVNKYFPDLMHLNPEGHDIVTPYIQNIMGKTMSAE